MDATKSNNAQSVENQFATTFKVLRNLLIEILTLIKLKANLYGRTLLNIIILLQLIFIFLIGIWLSLMVECGIGLEKLGLSLASSVGILGAINLCLVLGAIFLIYYFVKDL